jgi:hypothetical protein
LEIFDAVGMQVAPSKMLAGILIHYLMDCSKNHLVRYSGLAIKENTAEYETCKT